MIQVASGAQLRTGTGDPNGAVTGSIGDLFQRTDGGADTTLYRKESGNLTNTGWVAVTSAIPPDYKAKVDGSDTTAGYLDDKLSFENGLVSDILSPGGDESVLTQVDPEYLADHVIAGNGIVVDNPLDFPPFTEAGYWLYQQSTSSFTNPASPNWLLSGNKAIQGANTPTSLVRISEPIVGGMSFELGLELFHNTFSPMNNGITLLAGGAWQNPGNTGASRYYIGFGNIGIASQWGLMLVRSDGITETIIASSALVDPFPAPTDTATVDISVTVLRYNQATNRIWLKYSLSATGSAFSPLSLSGILSDDPCLTIIGSSGTFNVAMGVVGYPGEKVSKAVLNTGDVTISLVPTAIIDGKAKVDASDTTPGYLDDKLSFDNGLVSDILSPGGNESILARVDPEYLAESILPGNAVTVTPYPIGMSPFTEDGTIQYENSGVYTNAASPDWVNNGTNVRYSGSLDNRFVRSIVTIVPGLQIRARMTGQNQQNLEDSCVLSIGPNPVPTLNSAIYINYAFRIPFNTQMFIYACHRISGPRVTLAQSGMMNGAVLAPVTMDFTMTVLSFDTVTKNAVLRFSGTATDGVTTITLPTTLFPVNLTSVLIFATDTVYLHAGRITVTFGNPGGIDSLTVSDGDVTVGLSDNPALSAAGSYGIGDPTVNGSWRWRIVSNELTFERREGGVWVQKGSFTP